MSIQIITFAPEERSDEWERAVRARWIPVPDGRQIIDRGGLEARRFGLRTSGHALLYHSSGRLLFSGGITPSRGHQGPNSGVDQLIDAILGPGSTSAGVHPVYGCPLSAEQGLAIVEDDP